MRSAGVLPVAAEELGISKRTRRRAEAGDSPVAREDPAISRNGAGGITAECSSAAIAVAAPGNIVEDDVWPWITLPLDGCGAARSRRRRRGKLGVRHNQANRYQMLKHENLRCSLRRTAGQAVT